MTAIAAKPTPSILRPLHLVLLTVVCFAVVRVSDGLVQVSLRSAEAVTGSNRCMAVSCCLSFRC